MKSYSISFIFLSIFTFLSIGSITAESELYWTSPISQFDEYMTIVAFVEMEGNDLEGDQYEIGCFIDGECRGNVKLRQQSYRGHNYIAYLSIFGSPDDNGAAISFMMYDGTEIYNIEEKISYVYQGNLDTDPLTQLTVIPIPVPTYSVSVSPSITNGTITPDKTSATAGEKVFLTVTPDYGYELLSISTTPSQVLSGEGDIHTFIMPGSAVTVNASFQLSQVAIDVAAAKVLVDGLPLFNIQQADGNDKTSIKNYVTNAINNLLTGRGITVEVVITGIAPATSGNGANANGINGSFNYTVTLSKENVSDTVTKEDNIITATPYLTYTISIADGMENGKVTSLVTKSAPGNYIQLTIEPNTGFQLEDIIVAEEDNSTNALPLSGSGNLREFAMPVFNVTVSATFQKDQATQDADAVAAAKLLIADALIKIKQSAGNTEDAVKTLLKDSLAAIIAETGVYIGTITIINEFTAAIAGTEGNPNGTDGNFDFTAYIYKGNAGDFVTKTGNTITASKGYNISLGNFSDFWLPNLEKTFAVEGETVTFTILWPLTAYELDYAEIEGVGKPSFNATVTGDNPNICTFVMPDYDVYIYIYLRLSEYGEDYWAVQNAIGLIASNSFDINEADGNTKEDAEKIIMSMLEELLDETGVLITNFRITSFTPAADGNNGSFIFVLDLYKGDTDPEPTSKTGTIIATPVPVYSIAIAPDIDHGEVLADKLEAKANETVALTITPDEDYRLNTISVYRTDTPATIVDLDAGGDSYSFSMPAFDVTVSATFVKTQATLDREDVATAKARIESAEAFDLNQSEFNTEAEVMDHLVEQINQLLTGLGITVAENDIVISNFSQAIKGDASDPDGTDGGFDFTVTLTKGDAVDTATKTGNTIAAIEYISFDITILEMENGSVTSNKEEAQESETVSLTIYPAEGYELVSISVYRTGTTDLIDLTGTGDTRIFIMPAFEVTVSATFQKTQATLDAEAVAAAKALLNAAGPFDVNQKDFNTEAEVKDYLLGRINELLAGSGISVTADDIVFNNFAKATEGDASDPDGTDGGFDFTVTLTKGSAEDSVTKIDNTIIATGYIPADTYRITVQTAENGKVTSDKTYATEGETVELTITPDGGCELASISVYKTGTPTNIIGISGTGDTRTFIMPAFDVTVSATFQKTQATLDAEAVAAAKKLIEDISFEFDQEDGNTEEELIDRLVEIINDLLDGTGITISADDILIENFFKAIAGTEDDPNGTDGGFDFTVTLSKGDTSDTTDPIDATISATPFGTAIKTIERLPLRASVSGNGIYLKGIEPGDVVSIYNIHGQLIKQKNATVESQEIELPNPGIYIITNAGRQIKVVF